MATGSAARPDPNAPGAFAHGPDGLVIDDGLNSKVYNVI
jgi:hypothetical protein